MHRRVTTRRPATALAQEPGVLDFANVNPAPAARGLRLGMAFEAEICITLGEQLAVDRTVRLMADDAAFAQGFVLEGKRPRLLLMTPGAGFIHPGHRQGALGFENVSAVRIVALDTVHALLDHWMMIRQFKIGVRRDVTLQTRRRVAAGIQNELPRPTRCHVQAAGPMT